MSVKLTPQEILIADGSCVRAKILQPFIDITTGTPSSQRDYISSSKRDSEFDVEKSLKLS